jgi:ABC-2 type transport system permease protein
MSAAAATPAPLPRTGRVTFPHVALSEWTKLVSLRSTRYSLVAAVVMTIGLAAAACAVVANHWPHMSPHDRANFHPLEVTFVGVQLAQLAIGVLGVLVISGEYSTGMIRSTLIAVPKRLPVLWAKVAVYGAVAFALMLPSVLIAFFVGQSILSNRHIQIGFGHPGAARAVVGAALYLTVIGIFGLALGAIVRNTAGGIATFAGILFVLPPLLNVLPTSWNDAISPYMPSNAGEAVLALTRGDHSLGPWTGFALFCGYTLLALALASVVLVRRDA